MCATRSNKIFLHIVSILVIFTGFFETAAFSSVYDVFERDNRCVCLRRCCTWRRASARTNSRKSRKSRVHDTKKKKIRRSHGISLRTIGVYVCARDRWARTSGPDNIFPRRKNTNSTKRSNSFLLFSFRFHSITSLNHAKFSSTVSIRHRLLYSPYSHPPPPHCAVDVTEILNAGFYRPGTRYICRVPGTGRRLYVCIRFRFEFCTALGYLYAVSSKF